MRCIQALAVLVATATSTLTTPRQTTDPGLWSITAFLVSGAPYSLYTTYSFAITDNTTATTCLGVFATTPGIGDAPDISCENTIYSAAFLTLPEDPAPVVPGYYLQVWEEDPADVMCGAPATRCVWTGRMVFPASDVVTVVDPSGSGNPNGDYEVLETAPELTIERHGAHI